MDFPYVRLPNPPVIHTWSRMGGAMGLPFSANGGGGNFANAASATWQTANAAVYVPVFLSDDAIAYQLLYWVGATSSGNIDVGIYSDTGVRLTSTGSTAMSGTTNTLQELNITDLALNPGPYMLAVAVDNTTGTTFLSGSNNDELVLTTCPIWFETSAFPLPAIATPVLSTVTGPRLPFVGAQLRSLL